MQGPYNVILYVLDQNQFLSKPAQLICYGQCVPVIGQCSSMPNLNRPIINFGTRVNIPKTQQAIIIKI